MVLHGSTPDQYGRWLEIVSRWIRDKAPAQEQIVFINAWNEWAEGAYLEPDRHFGHAYLAETARVLTRLSQSPAERAGNPVVMSTTAPPGRARQLMRRATTRGAQLAERLARVLRSI